MFLSYVDIRIQKGIIKGNIVTIIQRHLRTNMDILKVHLPLEFDFGICIFNVGVGITANNFNIHMLVMS